MLSPEREKQLLEELKKYDTPSITNVVATYPKDTEMCLGLYNPWESNWYSNEDLKCMYPELGRLTGYAITVTFGLPDPNFSRLTFLDLYKAIEASPKPVILCMKQNFPERIKKKNGLAGGNMMTAFKSLGCVGVISDGPSRDLDEVRPLGIQYMLTGVTAGHGAFAIQEINTPVDICGMEVMPGDIIHMDENGAVKFPPQYLEQVNELCQKLSKFETKKQSLLAQHSDAETLAKIMADQYK